MDIRPSAGIISLAKSEGVMELIRLKADVNMVSKEKLTSLWHATVPLNPKIRSFDIIKLLVKYGAIIEPPLRAGESTQLIINQAQEQIKKDTEQCVELALICRKDDRIPKELVKEIFKKIELVNEKPLSEVETKS